MVDDKLATNTEHADDSAESDVVIGRALKFSFAFLALVGITVACVFAFRPREETTEEKQTDVREANRRKRVSVDGGNAEQLAVPAFKFTDITKQAGIDFVHENGESMQKLLPETMTGGVAFFDYDSDGDPDLLFTNFRRWPWEKQPEKTATPALYENDGKGNFKNVTAGSGFDVPMYGMGVACADYDGDGRIDVYFTSLYENRLFRNLGKGKFKDVTKTAGVAGAKNEWSTSAGFFDCDNDGDLDLFVCNYVMWTRKSDLGHSFNLIGGRGRAYGRPQVFNGSTCRLFRNEGNGKFTDITKPAGITVLNSKGGPFAKSLGVAFSDLDRDGYLDIVVANDTVRNFAFLNKRFGIFRESSERVGVAYDTNSKARGAMGIDAAWFRNNREIGIAIGNFSNEMTALYVSHRGGPLFTDDAVSNGIGPVTRHELTFGLFFFDADLDGRLDIFASNGHLEKEIAKVQAAQSYNQPPQLLWNGGPGFNIEFLPVVEPEPPPVALHGDSETLDAVHDKWKQARDDFRARMADFVKPMVGRAAAYADIDLDGDLDIVIAGNGQPPRLLRNDQQLGHNWLQVKIKGTPKNRHGIGTLVEVQLPDKTILRQRVMPTRSYQASVELSLTFGLGKAKRVEKIVVTPPGGKSFEVKDEIELNHRMTISIK